MRFILRILLVLIVWAFSIHNTTAQQMRPQYHSFNSAPPITASPAKAKFANSTNVLYDSTDYYEWDTTIAGWQLKSKAITKSYDSKKNALCVVGKTLVDGVWENLYKNNYTYDHKNNLTSKVYSSWEGSWVKQKNETYTYMNHYLTSYTFTQFNGHAWENIEKIVFSYDKDFNKIKESYLSGSGSVWLNNYQYIYEYDAFHNRLTENYQLGNDSTWRNVAKWSYVYNDNHNRLSETYMNWENGNYVNSSLFIYTYDSNNNVTKQVSQNWEEGTWVNSNQTAYTYDAKNNKIKELVERWNDISWENRLQTTFTYDKNNNNTALLMQEFILDKWANVCNFKYTYDAAKNKIESHKQDWRGEAWYNREKVAYAYNFNGDQTMEINFKWKNGKWIPAFYNLHVYDNNYVLTDQSYKSWNIVIIDENANTNYPPFITGDSTHHYLHQDTSTGDQSEEITKNDLLVYPNPSNGTFHVTFNDLQSIQNLEVYDATGKLVVKQQESDLVTIPACTPGIYYIKLQHNSSHYSKRIVVQ